MIGWVEALLLLKSCRLLLEAVVESLSVDIEELSASSTCAELSRLSEDMIRSIVGLDSIAAGGAVILLGRLYVLPYRLKLLSLSGLVTTMTGFAMTIGNVPLVRSRTMDGCRQYNALPTSLSFLGFCHVSPSFKSHSSSICFGESLSRSVMGLVSYRWLEDLRS